MDDKEFQTRADEALKDLYDRLGRAMEDHPFEADFNAGALAIEFEDSATKFVVSPNAPVKQIWVSAQMKSYKLDWDPARGAFVVNGKTLVELIDDVVGKQLGTKVDL
jgi:iron donor protein CyaY